MWTSSIVNKAPASLSEVYGFWIREENRSSI